MNVLVHNKRGVIFQIPDLDVQVIKYSDEDGVIVLSFLKEEKFVNKNLSQNHSFTR